MINSISLEKALEVLGQLLHDRDLHYEIAAIGGGSLLLLGLIERATKDLDLVALVKDNELVSADPLPQALAQAAIDVGNALELSEQWFNGGPSSLLQFGLPSGFMDRAHVRDYKGLKVHLASRFDQICFKLYASVDQGPDSKHFSDLLHLKPSNAELQRAKNWCLTHDPSQGFETDINSAIKKIHAAQ